MPLAFPSGYSASTKTPTIALAVNLGVSARSSGSAQSRICLIGNKLSSGTATVEQLSQVYSPDDARTQTGAGSETFDMYSAVYKQYRGANVWICPVAEAGGAVAATGTVLFAGTPTAAGVADVWIAGYKFEYVVGTSDTPTTIAVGLAAKINASTDLLATASSSSGTLTLTHKQKGPRGNQCTLRALVTATGVTAALCGGTASAAPAAAHFGDGTSTSGAGSDDITNALAAIASQKFDRVVIACDDATNAGRLLTFVNTYSGITERKRCQGEFAFLGSVAAAKTLATGENASLLRMDYHRNSDDRSGIVAAACAAAKLYGDGQVGGGIGRVKGEDAYRACNLDGVMVAAVRAQVSASDQLLGTEVEDLLNNGVTPLVPSPANPGYCKIVKSITTRSIDAASHQNYSVTDTSKVTVSQYVADTIEADIANEFPNKNLMPDPGDDSPPPTEDVIFPSHIRTFVAKRLGEMQTKQGLLINVEQNLPLLTVEQSVDDPTIVLIEIPETVIPHFHSMFGSVSQIG